MASGVVLALGQPDALCNSIRMANVYPEENLVAIGFDRRIINHGDVHREVRVKNPNISLNNDPVGGWLDRNNRLILSLAQFGRLALPGQYTSSPSAHRAEIDRAVSICERAIKLAEGAGFEVLLQAELPQDKIFALWLGRLHQAHNQSSLLSDALVKERLQKIGYHDKPGAISVIYDFNQRVRYLLPNELHSLRDCLNDRETFLHNLSEIKDDLFPDAHGSCHARFLVVEPTTREVITNDAALEHWNDWIATIVETANNSKDQDWSTTKEIVQCEIDDLIGDLKRASHSDFHSIKLDDRTFIESMASLLRGGQEDLGLGSDFSTNLTPLPTGRFISGDSGRYRFQSDPEADRTTSAIANWAINTFTLPQSPGSTESKINYVCVLEPEGPLTVEHMTSRSLLDFSRVVPKAYVVILGERGGEQLRIVVRENMYAAHTWPHRDTERVRDLLRQYSKEDLSKSCGVFRKHQYLLIQAIACSIPNGRISFANPYENCSISCTPADPCKDNYEYRAFVNGTRLDHEDISQWTVAHFKETVSILGELIAVGFISQLPELLESDIVIDKRDKPSGAPAHITYLSASGSFSEESEPGNDLSYFVTASRLYGNFIASWIERCLYHPCCSDLDVAEREDLTEELLSACLKSVETSLTDICKNTTNVIDREIQEVRTAYSQLSQVPEDLRLPAFLGTTKHWLAMKTSWIDLFRSTVEAESAFRLRLFSKVAPPVKNPDRDQEAAEATIFCVKSLSSLLHNHIIEKRSSKIIDQIVKESPKKLSLLSPRQRGWIFATLDVAARLSELHFSYEQFTSIVQAAREANDAATLFNEFEQLDPPINLTPQLVEMFREASMKIDTKLRDLPNDCPERTQLERAMETMKEFFEESD